MLLHLINLDRSPERLADFWSANGHLKSVTRFPAIDGGAVNLTDFVQAGTIREETGRRYTRHALGVALSHLALWDKAIATGEMLTICEDDAIFNHQFEALSERMIGMLPVDWDIVMWGWNFVSALLFELLPNVSPCLAVFDEQQLRQSTGAFQAQTISARPFKLRQALGLVCYSISPKGAAALKQLCLPLRDTKVYCVAMSRELPTHAIDVAMMAHYEKLNAFVSFPPLVVTKNQRGANPAVEIKSNVAWEKPARTDVDVERLKLEVERAHGGRAVLAESVKVSEQLGGNTLWEGVVHVFDIYGLPQLLRAYAWMSPVEGQMHRRFFTVLHTPPALSASSAVRAVMNTAPKE